MIFTVPKAQSPTPSLKYTCINTFQRHSELTMIYDYCVLLRTQNIREFPIIILISVTFRILNALNITLSDHNLQYELHIVRNRVHKPFRKPIGSHQNSRIIKSPLRNYTRNRPEALSLVGTKTNSSKN